MLSPLTRSAGLISFLLLRPTALAVAYTPSSPTRNMASAHPKEHMSLEEAGVVPDVLPPFQPSVSIRVSYDRMHVRAGDQLLPVQAVHVPLVSLEGAEAGKNYTLIMYVCMHMYVCVCLPGVRCASPRSNRSNRRL